MLPSVTFAEDVMNLQIKWNSYSLKKRRCLALNVFYKSVTGQNWNEKKNAEKADLVKSNTTVIAFEATKITVISVLQTLVMYLLF